MVSHKSKVYIICDSIRKDANLSSFKKLQFEKFYEGKLKMEEAIYYMLCTFKKVPMEMS